MDQALDDEFFQRGIPQGGNDYRRIGQTLKKRIFKRFFFQP